MVPKANFKSIQFEQAHCNQTFKLFANFKSVQFEQAHCNQTIKLFCFKNCLPSFSFRLQKKQKQTDLHFIKNAVKLVTVG